MVLMSECMHIQLSPTLCNPMDCSPPGSSVQGDSPGKKTGVGCHVLFQGIFPTQISNPGLSHCRWILYLLSHKGSPSILEADLPNPGIKPESPALQVDSLPRSYYPVEVRRLLRISDIKEKMRPNVLCLGAQLCLTLYNPMDCSPLGSSVHGDSPGKKTGVGCHALLQGIFPSQELKPGLPHCRKILHQLSHQGSP